MIKCKHLSQKYERDRFKIEIFFAYDRIDSDCKHVSLAKIRKKTNLKSFSLKELFKMACFQIKILELSWANE